MEQQEKDIATVFQGTATKASGSKIGFEVGRERGKDELFLRVTSNDGGGTFTKAWQSVAALQAALAPYRKDGKGLRFASALGPVIPQKGRNNAPFVGYILASIGILAANPEVPGEYTVAGDWEPWRANMLAMPVPPPLPPPPPVGDNTPPQKGGESAPAPNPKAKRPSKKGTGDPLPPDAA